MKRTTLFFMVLISLLLASGLWAVDKKQMEKWVTILTEKDPAIKYQKLEEFKTQYGNDKKSSTLIPVMYQNLNETSYTLKKYDKAVEYGEKALTFMEIDEQQKLLIIFRLANAYSQQQDLNKAMEYAQKTIDRAEALKTETNAQSMALEFTAPALRLQAKVINNAKPNDPQAMLEAQQKALAAFKADKSPESDKLVRTLANMLRTAGRDADFWKSLEDLYTIKPDFDLAKSLGLYFTQQVKDDAKALGFFLAAYDLKKSYEVAYYLGILYNKASDVDNSLNYLADSYVQVEKSLRDLFLDGKMKDQPLPQEEKEKAFYALLESAKVQPLANGSTGNPPTLDTQINRQADFLVMVEKVLMNIFTFKKMKDSTLPAEEKDKAYQLLLDSARGRLGLPTPPPAPLAPAAPGK